MTTHKYFGHDIRIRLIHNLKSLLEYYKESYSNSELLSYSNKELKQLINRYSIKIRNVDDPYNSWYGPGRHYLKKPYNFITDPSHYWYRTNYAMQLDC